MATLEHCYQATNGLADFSTNVGVEENTPLNVFNVPLTASRDILFADICNFSWPRVVRQS